MSTFLDSRGIIIKPDASAHTITRLGHSPCHASYLWRVEQRWDGHYYMTPRPYQLLPDIRLTDDISRFLVVVEEVEAFIPESHPEIWDEFLRLGWGIHSGFLPKQSQDIWHPEPCMTLGICNTYNNFRDQYTLPGVVYNSPLNLLGLSEHAFAERAWTFYLTRAKEFTSALRN